MSFEDSVDLTAVDGWCRPKERARCEIFGAKMAVKELPLWGKVVTTVFLLGWMVWTGVWVSGLGETTPTLITVYSLASALGFSIIGSLHGIKMDEMREMAQGSISVTFGKDE
jgi:hypothetical protein